MKILAFGASNSSKSINKQLVTYAAAQLKEMSSDTEIEILDLNDYEMPIYSSDREEASGIPEKANLFREKIGAADAILISYAEHNGNYSAAYKNIFDWTSRIDAKVYQGKPMVIMSTSPGPGGAASVLGIAKTSAPHFNADVKGAVSIPSFYDNFDMETGQLTNDDLKSQILDALKTL